MSLGKLPVMSWVSGSHSKRRLKGDLTPDMISPPLGDFRHTMHVGRGGDAFGDTSFLRNHGGEVAKHSNFFARTLRHVRRSPLRNRASRSKDEASPIPPAISPIIKNAISLPQLNEGSYGNDGRGVNFAFKSTPNSFSDYGLESGFCTIPRVPRSEKTQDSSHANESALTRSDSLLSFRLDLGPSLMSELLHVISFSGDLSDKDRREEDGKEEESKPPVGSDSPPHLKNTWAEDSLPWRSGSLHNNCEESKVSSGFWSRSEANLPLGHSVCTNGDSHSIELSQEGSPCSRGKSSEPGAAANEGVLPKEIHWQEHQNDCNMQAIEIDRATRVLACHYGPGSTYHSLQQQEDSGRQASWASPDANIWHSKVGLAVQQPHKAGWHQRTEEEEEEEEEDFSGDCAAFARKGHSDSFEYVDEDEEDEVKV
ncbi:cdc42 effector protein 1 [Eublepharis macularius]|uniref:Cdc42 effector protein 1 n=1 Tax=Eublepharis macularius TaxID=481883 RepID=A0AA97L6R0_EUBMA|nr:cdc42 effector protein 1 [Eublepharis macularius]XP_054844956.1 cdc42 effector protein 1 [Eublepharis macularius]